MATQSSDEALYKPYDQFILFGDSITEMSSTQEMGYGLQAALQDAYRRRLDVINRGFGGYTTAHAIQVLPKFFPKPERAEVRFMTIFFGANDASVPGNSQHVPLDDYKDNLLQIIQYPKTVVQDTKVIMLTPTPVNEYQLQSFDEVKGNDHPSRTAANAKLYAEAAREVATSVGVPVADAWTAFMDVAGWEDGEPLTGSRDLPNNEKFQSLFTDGLHLSADGYRILYNVLMETIRTNWPEEHPEQVPMVFPTWGEAPR